MPIEDVSFLLDIIFDDKKNVFGPNRDDKLGLWLVKRLIYLIDYEKENGFLLFFWKLPDNPIENP